MLQTPSIPEPEKCFNLHYEGKIHFYFPLFLKVLTDTEMHPVKQESAYL